MEADFSKIIFRNDDVNPSSSYKNIIESNNVISTLFPHSSIISCITLFSRFNTRGSVYGEVPFKDRPVNWFYNVDKFLLEYEYITKPIVASHGLFHVKHSIISKDAQEMSILGSCNFLRTNIFCAPFNAYNEDTVKICGDNGIRLLNKEFEWRSLDFEQFNPAHKYWYFHSWKFTPDELRRKLVNNASLNN